MSEWVAYDNKDLLNLVNKAIDEYFYDMPINISSVQFTNNGGKMNSLGGTIWSGKKSKIVNNCNDEQINEPYEITINCVLKGFDIKKYSFTRNVSCSTIFKIWLEK